MIIHFQVCTKHAKVPILKMAKCLVHEWCILGAYGFARI